MRTVVLGGARSGKSAFAEDLVGSSPCTYVATARPWPGDEDFAARIAVHVARRPAEWGLIDDRDLVEVLEDPTLSTGTVLVDDMGTWLTHTIDRLGCWDEPNEQLDAQIDRLVAALGAWPEDRPLILVTPEVGMGIIPEHRSGRIFRDLIGSLNGRVAAACESAVFVVAGCPLVLKHPGEGVP